MKRFILCLCALTLMVSVADAQPKASKDARKQAKELIKQGWQTMPGKMSLERQIDRSIEMENELDDLGFPKYIWGEGTVVGQSYDAAKMQAMTDARTELAANIQTEVSTLIKSSVANKEVEPEEANSVNEMIAANIQLVQQNIGRVIPVVECYLVLPNNNKQVAARVIRIE